MNIRIGVILLSAAAAFWGGGCGGATGGGRLLELRIGEEWTYRVTEDGGDQRLKKNVVEGEEDVGGRFAGVTAFRVRMETLDGVNMSWQKDTGTAIQRLRDKTYDENGTLEKDESYEPFKLRIDEAKLGDGATWTEYYVEYQDDLKDMEQTTRQRADQWTIESLADVVNVPAGQFSCVRVKRVALETSSIKTYWFAAGVGKVKEESDGQVEELAAHTVP